MEKEEEEEEEKRRRRKRKVAVGIEGSSLGMLSLSRFPRAFLALVSSNDGKREAESPQQIPLGWDLRDEKGQEAFFAASGSSLMSPDVPPNFQAGSASRVKAVSRDEKLLSRFRQAVAREAFT